MKTRDVKFDFDDILIEPKKTTTIKSRFEDINPQYTNEIIKPHYPVFTAPMDSVVDLDNMMDFIGSDIPVVLPRTINHIDYYEYISNEYDDRNSDLFPKFTFMSYSLNDFKSYYHRDLFDLSKYVLIDTANGHIKDILDAVKKAREIHNDLIIMVGNIANPDTYRWYGESELVDYIRIGIGNGNGCLTTQQTGIGFPKASLIAECRIVKEELLAHDIKCPMIVADGGMKDYSDIIKALALGADYVMVGSLFNKALESAGDNYLHGIKINPNLARNLYNLFPVKKKFYGMSTKIAQKKMGNETFKTSEGVVRYRKIEYTLSRWIDNFDHYLRSAMSYTNSRTLYDFIGNVEYNFISENAFNRFKK